MIRNIFTSDVCVESINVKEMYDKRAKYFILNNQIALCGNITYYVVRSP